MESGTRFWYDLKMLRVVAHKSAVAARQYYAEGLRREDYYSQGQEVVGKWHGKAAGLLGLSGNVTPEGFAALVENRNPVTGERLTPRTKTERRVGYDLNFHAPKSLSILHALTGDEGILKSFREAVSETMQEIEALASTRVRRGGAQSERLTGNLAWAEFIHFTARPVGGIPDPHLHIHCFAFNTTHDAEEGRWKAASWAGIKKDAPYSEAVFHSRLADKLAGLGYGITRTRQGWEISGIPRTLIDKFSRRTAQIERLADSKGITDPKEKDSLGATSREGKRHGMTYSDLLAAWGVRLTPDEKVLISTVGLDKSGARSGETITPAKAFDEASEKLFSRSSVVEVKRLIAETLRFGVGSVTPETAWREFERRRMVVRNVAGEELCTSVDVLAEEIELINFVRSGRGMCAPFKGKHLKFGDDRLSAEQKAAVRHVLSSRDQIVGIRGGAGVGKTTLMREAVAQIEATGLKVFAFAPSAAAARETLREAGFSNAETLAHLLANQNLQTETRGQVIWIDEAGLVGIRDMAEIMRIAGNSTRIILTGDTAQHAPVARGDAFRLMQHYAGLRVAEVTEIRRQEREDYRKAVAALSKGDLRTGFRRLEEMGAIVEVTDDAERYRLLAHDFLALSRKNSVPLVVSPTHAEGEKVTNAIREAKRQAGRLGPEKTFTRYHNLQWEEPDRRRAENYRAGLVVQFHQNVHSIQRGAVFRVMGQDEKGAIRAVSPSGREIELPLGAASQFQVFEERAIQLARGDRIRITHNGKSDDGRRLNNGNLFTVEGFSRDGKIILNTGAVLDSKHGHFTYGYCQTSHSSQSKSVRDVLVAQSTDSLLASSLEQFYVSVSRGKESIRIYTDNRQELQEAVGNSSARRAGVEFAGISPKEAGALVNGEKDGRQWRDLIQSRRAEGAAKSHVQNLLQERKQDGLAKPANMDFRQYLEMRRKMAGPDGKSRSKGHPGGSGKGKAEIQNRGRSFLRPTQPQHAPKTAAANENKKPVETQTRQSRLAKGYEAAKNHFNKVSERVKGAAKSIREGRKGKPLPASNTAQVSKHNVKQRNADAATKGKTQNKIAQKAPAPPTPKRGR
jgi:conjugative relaxase-like TrwC/TraI family protein